VNNFWSGFWTAVVVSVLAVIWVVFSQREFAYPAESWVIKDTYKAVAKVQVWIPSGFGWGTTVSIGDGKWLTAKHMVDDAFSISVNGQVAFVDKMGPNDTSEDMDDDWAILTSYRTRSVAHTFQFEVGDHAFRIGNDHNYGLFIAEGVIGEKTKEGLYPLSCSIAPGASGGGVFNDNGELIGIIVRRAGDAYLLFVPLQEVMFQ